MRKFMALLLASTCLAAATVLAMDDVTFVGDTEYTSPEIDPGYGPVNSLGDELAARSSCPRGFERVPQYRWNQRSHRWEFSGWACRRNQRPN